MSLSPLLQASPAIQVHAFAAMTAFLLGIAQLAAPKGTLPHRTVGWIWATLMFVVSVTAFFIHQIRLWGRGARSTFWRSLPWSCCLSGFMRRIGTRSSATAAP
jgi:uncharacterized membrane protein